MTEHLVYRTIRDDFFSPPPTPIEDITLMGTQCKRCGEVFLGKTVACQNCQNHEFIELPLSREGTLFSYTVVRNKPPGDYKGRTDPFVPYPVGLVELPDGLRITAVLDCPIERLAIGMPLSLVIHELYHDEDGTSVLAYKFKSASPENV